MLCLHAIYFWEIDQCALHYEISERISYENDKVLDNIVYSSIYRQLCNKLFDMIMYLVARYAIYKWRNLCIVIVDHYPYLLFLQYRSQIYRGPDRRRWYTQPSILWIFVKIMDKDNIDLRINNNSIHLCKSQAFDSIFCSSTNSLSSVRTSGSILYKRSIYHYY